MFKTAALLFLTFTLALAETQSGVYVGDLKTRQHNTKGAVYAIDEKTILVKQFTYDGTAPDAFFFAGKTGTKPNLEGTILPYPFSGKFYEYDDLTSPKLTTAFDGTKDITLKLPDNLKVSEVKWFSVWCREFGVVLAELKFPSDFSFDNVVAFPGPIGHDGDAEAEPEGEAEPHNGGVSNQTGLISAVILATASMFFSYSF